MVLVLLEVLSSWFDTEKRRLDSTDERQKINNTIDYIALIINSYRNIWNNSSFRFHLSQEEILRAPRNLFLLPIISRSIFMLHSEFYTRNKLEATLARCQKNRQVAVEWLYLRIRKDVEMQDTRRIERRLLTRAAGTEARGVPVGWRWARVSLSARCHQGAQVRRDVGVGVVSSLSLLFSHRPCVNVARGTRDATERGRSPEDREDPVVERSVLRRVAARRSTDFDMSLGSRAFVS